jgi:excisionase family DNA binding protein
MLTKINDLTDRLERQQKVEMKRYLSKKEAAAYIDKTTSYIDKLIWSKEIPYYQPSSHSVYIDRLDLDRYMTKVRFKSAEELNRQAKIPLCKKNETV